MKYNLIYFVMKRMDHITIDKLLLTHRTDGALKTHVTMGNFKASYVFNTRDIETLFQVYCEAIKNNKVICLAEMIHNTKCLPILVDVDIKLKENLEEDDYIYTSADKIYNKEHVEKLIKIYQSVLRTVIDECNDDHLLCVVLEKPLYKDTVNGVTYIKNGFHLHFPNTFMSVDDQKIQLIPRILQSIEEYQLFNDLKSLNCIVKIDDGYCSAPWLMYGARKDANRDPYTVTMVINSNGDDISLYDAFKKYKIYDSTGTKIKITLENVELNLPRILSIIPFPSNTKPQTMVKKGLLSPIREKIKNNIERKTKEYKKNIEEDLGIAKPLLGMLCDYRAENRNDWIEIGWILFNISHGNQDGLDLWKDFSMRCPNLYDESKCIYEWDRMVLKNLSVGTLKFYAQQDNPEEYKKFKHERAIKLINESLNLTGTHYDIAKIMYEEYKDEFKCSNPDSTLGEWYHFKNHIWQNDKQGITLSSKLSEDIYMMYKSIFDSERLKNTEDDNPHLEAKLKQIKKIMTSLKSNNFKNGVMKECKALFYDKIFNEKLNMNKDLFAFKNGIYDLKQYKFRDGIPEDYISKSAPIDYIEFSEDDEEVRQVYIYLEQVFPNINIRTYFLDIYSEIFRGGNKEKLILFWTGHGNNAKTVTQKIFENMLGKYAIKLEPNVVTGKKISAGSANADLSRAGNGVRWAAIEEPEFKEHLNVGILKRLSGNDSCFVRDLYEKGKDTSELTFFFKLAIICNELPPISHSDQAIWNRIRVLHFESTFTNENVPDTYEEQLQRKIFPADETFVDEKLPKMLNSFAWVLLNHRKKMICRMEPSEVKVATECFRKNNDTYRQFIEECIVKQKDSILSLSDLYSRFKIWFKESYPGYQIPIKDDVKKHFCESWKNFDTRGSIWRGYKLRTAQDDENDLKENDRLNSENTETETETEKENEEEGCCEEEERDEESESVKSNKVVHKFNNFEFVINEDEEDEE